ncbi:PTS fructose transporter subunit IIA [Helcococcus ovis]|uniref:PTS fructose transporter subunit IIC n=1 Tax=Helcococcus ovis TaxID=72026 RepID=UPI0010703B0B|nr:PTS fructose transporter subunit IIC [Helcococcus ovis]TFF68760.1 PTS fructose transporter subunit IIA [Helcococcus ovis]WNZ01222.1 PTS fructose transporter subunit IIC [Helcococcus ovis]
MNKKIFNELQKAFNTGVSYMLPSVVVGGIFIALGLATGKATNTGMEVSSQFWKNIVDIGVAGFAMMIPLLSGYIAYSISGKPALAPGMILGYLANNPIGQNQIKTGFIGAMILGVATGYFIKWVKTWKVSSTIRTIMPILIIPIISVFTLSMIYIYLIASPIGALMEGLVNLLKNIQGGSAILLGVIIGAMTAIDMGGPINKTATAFTIALMAEGIYEPNGAHRVAVAIPPLAMAISTLVSKNRYTKEDKDLGLSALFMGMIGITEGAIPFAVKDMKRVLPSIIIGSAVGGAISMLQNVKVFVPHGGPIVLPAVEGRIWFILSILIGTLVSVVILHFTKPKLDIENIEVEK